MPGQVMVYWDAGDVEPYRVPLDTFMSYARTRANFDDMYWVSPWGYFPMVRIMK